MGHDDSKIFKKIEDVIIKTILSCEPIIKQAMDDLFLTRTNCFELFGFDILIDD